MAAGRSAFYATFGNDLGQQATHETVYDEWKGASSLKFLRHVAGLVEGTFVYASNGSSQRRLQDSRPGWIRCSPFL